ncbi:uncharacterized protein J3D65DRAFT_427165 [Phyllosticta citribraziliensis]|uniref:Secreted protein n=1 Tax=Phyllosticta citribraziliensis TaxID=989973 RepID=A0ABR1LI47_9PEZI
MFSPLLVPSIAPTLSILGLVFSVSAMFFMPCSPFYGAGKPRGKGFPHLRPKCYCGRPIPHAGCLGDNFARPRSRGTGRSPATPSTKPDNFHVRRHREPTSTTTIASQKSA